MHFKTVLKLIGALVFFGTFVLSIPGVYDSFLNYWNSKGIWGSVFQVGLQIIGISMAFAGGFIMPFIEADQWRTREERREVFFLLSTSMNLAFVFALIICGSQYGHWEHRQDHNILAAVFWFTILLASTISMMRSKSTRQFQGLRLVKP